MYNVTIRESSTELTNRQKVMLTTGTFASLDKAAPCKITPTGYAVLEVENTEAENGQYTKYVIMTQDGNYATGSETFFSTFKTIFEQMSGETEPWEIEVLRQNSRRREGKYFLTCNLIG